MTVRWKPLLILSGVFVAVALIGVAAIAYVMLPKGAEGMLRAARAERASKHYARAEIHYRQALQRDGRNPAIHEEMATMFADWAPSASPEDKEKVRASRLIALAEAAKFGKSLKAPRRALLLNAMERDEIAEGVHWAKETLALEPDNLDALYFLTSEALDERSPNVPELTRQVAELEAANAPPIRLAWVKAKLAQVAGDAQAREDVLAKIRAAAPPEPSNSVDRFALVRLRALDVETTGDLAKLAERFQALQAEAKRAAADAKTAPNGIIRLSLLLERVQKSLSVAATNAKPAEQKVYQAQVDAIEADVEGIFQKALAAASKTNLNVYLTYADHLRYRGQRDRCLEVVDQALQSPLAKLSTWQDVAHGLRAVAVETALADTKDAKRFDKAGPYIKDLIAASSPRFQGLGHLFQGAIELEQSGVAGAPAETADASAKTAIQPKLRLSALSHLKQAAENLPDVVEAQARYGVALILSQEMSLGRQYLQNAMRLGNAEPQFQIWAAWSMIQAGYPEEAEPIVNHLTAEVSNGRLTREYEGTLHLLSGEVHQARNATPDDLKRALAEYQRSYGDKAVPPSVDLRMAQIEIQLGQTDKGLGRIERLRAKGQGGTAAEHLAVLTLRDQGKNREAYEVLSKARQRFPDSAELVGVEAAMLSKDKKAKEADKALEAFLKDQPENVSVALMRAQLLADDLNDVKAARQLLINVADRSENSAPLVQLALLDIKQKDYASASGTIAKVRARWKEAAAADLLDAQLSLDQGSLADAVAHFDDALKKDPSNKLVQFWKAQLESRLGASSGAEEALMALARDDSSKRLDSGLTIPEAAKSALANLALQNGQVDEAIKDFENLRSNGGGLTRDDRWQLVSAYVAKNQWPEAKRELASLLNDPKNPPTPDERVQAANFYRLSRDEKAATDQLDYILSVNPSHPGGVVTRSYMLAAAKKTDEAAALIRQAIAKSGDDKPPAVFFLLLAAMENILPPSTDAGTRALKALDQGLEARPHAGDLVQAKYRLLLIQKDAKAAVAFVEAEAKADPDGSIPRFLSEVYREREDFAAAEKVLADLCAQNPTDAALAASHVRVVALQAARASDAGDREREKATQDRAAGLIRGYRAKFPNDVAFLQEDCELAFRQGDLARATSIAKEADQVAKNSPAGPLLRARLYSLQNRHREAAEAFNEALRRNPAQPEVRLALAQTYLTLNEPDAAAREAHAVYAADSSRVEARLVEARALASPAATPSQTASRRAQAIALIDAAIKQSPRLVAAYHLRAEILLLDSRRDDALASLKAGLTAVPEDAIGVSQLVELLASPGKPGEAPRPDRFAEAQALASSIEARDTTGNLTLALAVGFHKAGQLDLAETWIRKASAKLDSPVLHVNHGDILLSIAERPGDAAKSQAYFRQAIEQYDLVLKSQANSVEAVNNKAWILHSYLGDSQQALAIAENFAQRMDPAVLPSEFFDTLGAIQESTGKKAEAEQSYSRGLSKSPDHPVLNYHMGRLMIGDQRQADKARAFLEKAFSARERMNPKMAAEVASLWQRVNSVQGN